MDPTTSKHTADHGRFPRTRWSVVDRAAKGDSAAREALEVICRDYWYPLYAYARRSGQAVADAEDLTQGFFHTLLGKDWLAMADPEKGRLRTFLLTAFRRFMAKEWRRETAAFRGGGEQPVPLEDGEARYLEAQSGLSADQLFDRQWALTLIDRTIATLQQEAEDAGKANEFERLKETLMALRGGIDYEGLARQLNSTEGAVRVAVHRLRKRFRTYFRTEVERTLGEGENLEVELRYLASML